MRVPKQSYLFILFSSLFFIFVGTSSCQKKEACSSNVRDTYFLFRLEDQFGVNLVGAWGRRYKSDSTYLTKLNGDLPKDLQTIAAGDFSFMIAESDTEALDSTITRQYLLSLPDFNGHPHKDVDTITFKFRFFQSCYDHLSVYYNSSLYHDGAYIDFITFIKYD